ncbi:MAG: class II aldolase/adducin family protein [bacterium]
MNSEIFDDIRNKGWGYIERVIRELGQDFFPSTSGNISAKIDNIVVCTPSSVSKNKLTPQMLSIVDLDNNLLAGYKQTSEIHLHLEVYKSFPRVNFVIHTHPFFCCLFSCTSRKIRLDLLAEYYLKIGRIYYVDFKVPGTLELAKAVVEKVKKGNRGRNDVAQAVVLMRNHGLVVFSNNLDKAIDLTICTEQIAQLNYFGLAFRKLNYIPSKYLLELQKRYL